MIDQKIANNVTHENMLFAVILKKGDTEAQIAVDKLRVQ